MKPFLYEIAQKIINEKQNTNDFCLVFPNKRTKYYFRRYYAEIIGKTSKPPRMKEMNELVLAVTGYTDAEKLTLLFELFKVFKEFNSSYSFDNFYRLGEIILSDFNEIDAWLANPEQLYQNIKDIKELDSRFMWLTEEQKQLLSNFWKVFISEQSSKEKEMFIALWNLLPQVYKAYTARLRKKEIGYKGLIYRVLSDKVGAGESLLSEYEKIIFIGFNALNKAELKFFNYFQKQGRAAFYWDADAYYIADKKQEAGDFIRKNLHDLGIKDKDFPNNLSKAKSIKLVGTSLNLNQAKLIHTLLKNLDVETLKKTAIITADESMLFPVLSALPETVDNVNVTMGYPFKLTPLYNFIYKFLQLHLYAEKHKQNVFYYKNVAAILAHPYVKEYNAELAEYLIKQINEQKIIYVSPQQLSFGDNKLMNLLFDFQKDDLNAQAILANLLNILFLFFDKKTNENEEENSLKNEYIFRAYKNIKRFREILNENDERLSLKLSTKILIQLLKADTIPFESNFEKGLQIMGLMESRNLDFEHVIILGLNEGVIPKINRAPTFISQSLRYAFGMPLIKHLDSVYAYFFYRILQKAEDITLVYNDLVSDSNSGEMSRFVLQLLYESNFNILHQRFNDDVFIRNRKPLSISKDEAVLKKLDRYILKDEQSENIKMFSASALNTYISCSLKFYFKYIADIKEPDSVDAMPSYAEFGILLHKIMELIYDNLSIKGTEIEEKDIAALLPDIDDFVAEAFKEIDKSEKNYKPQGIRIIEKEVLKDYAQTILKYDMKYAPFKIVSLENEDMYHTDLDVKFRGKDEKVKLFGIIDRIDKKNGVYRILDYKSGNELAAGGSLDKLFDKKIDKRNTHIFQALFYTYIVSRLSDFSDCLLRPSLYYARSMNRNTYSDSFSLTGSFGKAEIDENFTEIILQEFKDKLIALMDEIFDDALNFEMTENTKNCEFCEYSNLCY